MKSVRTKAYQKYQFYKKALIFVFVITLMAIAWGYYYAEGLSSQVSKIITEAEFLRKESEVKTEATYKYNKVANFEKAVFDSMPDSKEISTYIATVEGLATKNNLAVSQSSIGATNTKTKQTNLELSQTINQKDYYELPIKFTIEGSYGNFLKLVMDLKSIRRLNTISDLTINKNTVDPGSDSIQASFTNSIYIKK